MAARRTTPAGVKDTRIFGFGEHATEQYEKNAFAYTHALTDSFRQAARKAWPAWIAEGAAVALPFWVLVHAAQNGSISIGTMAAAMAAVLGVLDIGGVGNETYIVETVLTSVGALDELEARTPDTWTLQQRRSSASPPTIRFEDVAFTYPGSERSVFNSLNLELRPGESVAIVGENGIGKSTLIKLLARFYEPTAGRITVDGTDVRQLPVDEWRGQLSIVSQNFTRLPLSVRENIALADWDHPNRDSLVERAVDASGACDVVAGLEFGLDTILSREFRGGTDLSGGQWQRVVLARAMYAAFLGASTLVLDEPTAHLDVQAEIELFDQLLTHTEGKTAVVVSHRYSTVRRAARIVVLGEAGVSEDGTHDQLVATGGTYARLYALQANAFVEAAES